MEPVRSGAAPIQQPRLGKEEGACADRSDTTRSQRDLAQEVEEAGRYRLCMIIAHDQHRIKGRIIERNCTNRKPRGAGDRTTFLRQQADLINRIANSHVGELKHRSRSEVEQLKPGKTIIPMFCIALYVLKSGKYDIYDKTLCL